jgi:hypothetical protein
LVDAITNSCLQSVVQGLGNLLTRVPLGQRQSDAIWLNCEVRRSSSIVRARSAAARALPLGDVGHERKGASAGRRRHAD